MTGPIATEANEEAFDEIWRPGRRKETRHAKSTGERDKPRREHPQQGGKRERHRPQAQPKRERQASVEHSPFAALEGRSGRRWPRAGRSEADNPQFTRDFAGPGAAARQVAVVREVRQDALWRRSADRSRQGAHQRHPRAEAEPPRASGRRGHRYGCRQAGGSPRGRYRRAARAAASGARTLYEDLTPEPAPTPG